jgi:dTDP-4-dehydrorhamnose 3,5-epimerase
MNQRFYLSTTSEGRPFRGELLAGCFITTTTKHQDERGSFTKILAETKPNNVLKDCNISELFYSRSLKSVVRGMHFQVPPYSGKKLVWLTEGQILDVIVDLRQGSDTFHKFFATVIDPDSGAIVVPEGCAHGYEVLSEFATVCYAQTMPHSSDHDTGILWNSFGMEWSTSTPILSARDLGLPLLSEFTSPFTFGRNC